MSNRTFSRRCRVLNIETAQIAEDCQIRVMMYDWTQMMYVIFFSDSSSENNWMLFF